MTRNTSSAARVATRERALTLVPPSGDPPEHDCGEEIAQGGQQEDEVARGPQVMLQATRPGSALLCPTRRRARVLTWVVAITTNGRAWWKSEKTRMRGCETWLCSLEWVRAGDAPHVL